MSEADLMVEIGFRTNNIWSLLQWWVSISFALMAAAYIGAKHLSFGLVATILSLYVLTFITTVQAMMTNQQIHAAAIEALSALSETTPLTRLGQHALGTLGGSDSTFFNLLLFLSLFFTIGVVIYCYKRERQLDK